MPSETCEIDLVGGPLDGLRVSIPVSSSGLEKRIAFPINENLLRGIHGESVDSPTPVTSVAIYDQRPSEIHWRFYRYCFRKAVSPTEIEIVSRST